VDKDLKVLISHSLLKVGMDLTFSVGGGGNPQNPDVTLSTSSSTVNVNQSFTLTWVPSDATSCQASSNGIPWWNGNKSSISTSHSESNSIATAGSYTASIQCFGSNGESSFLRSVNINVTGGGGGGNPPTADIKAGGLDSLTVTSGQSFNVTWSSTNATNCSVSPISGSGTSGSSPQSISATTTYNLNCSNSSGQSATDSVTVTVSGGPPPPPSGGSPYFTCSLTPASLSLAQGGGGSYTVYVDSFNGFSGSVSLSVSGLVSGVSGSFSPSSVNVTANSFASSSLSLIVGGSVTPGTYSLTVTGNGGGSSASCNAQYTITSSGSGGYPTPTYTYPTPTYTYPTPTYTYPTPASPFGWFNCVATSPTTISAGGFVDFSVQAGSNNGNTYVITGSVTSTAPGSTSTVTSANPQTSPPNRTFTFRTQTAVGTAPGTYTTTMTGTSGGNSYNCGVNFTIPAPNFGWFNCVATSATSVAQGGFVDFRVEAGSNNPPTAYTITASGSTGAPGSTVTVTSANPQNVPPNKFFTYRMQTSGSTTPGSYNVTLVGAVGASTRQCTVNFTVTAGPNFTMTCSPASVTVAAGSSGSYTVTLTRQNGHVAAVSVSAAITSSNPSSPANPPTFSASPNPVNSPGTSTSLVASTNGSTTPGTYTVTVSGTDGALNRACGATVQFVVQNSSYTVTPSLTFNATQGGANPTTQNITATNTGNVLLSPINVSRTLPSGGNWLSFTVGSFSLGVGGSSNVGVNVSIAGLAPGTYNGTIDFSHTGTPSAGNRQTAVTLIISSGAPNRPQNVSANNGVQCNRILVQWQAPLSGGNPVQGYYVYRSSTAVPPGSWGSPIFTKNNTTAPLEYLDSPPAGGPYYYAVSSYGGAFESQKEEAGVTPTALLPCQPNLGTSDKDIMALNGDPNYPTGTTPPTPCNNMTDPVKINGQQTSMKDGDIVTFRISICNTGNATASGLSMVDTLTNLSYVSPQVVQYGGACASASQPSVSGNNLTFSLPDLTAPPSSVCTVTFDAKITAPTGSSNSVFTFNNRAVITGNGPSGPVSKTVSTPLFLFGTLPTVPDRGEVAP
jgi:uncharacterized repeat protein (TIGR01451 family)